MSTNPFDDPDGEFHALVNDEGQYSLWPVANEVPAGWRADGFRGCRQECMDHVDEVIWVGANRKTAQRLGFRAASTLADALELASGTVGNNPSITYQHSPPHLIADVR